MFNEVFVSIALVPIKHLALIQRLHHGDGEEVEVVFFHLGHFVSDVELEKEYELRDLNPADPYSLAAVNKADPTFADTHPSGTHWKDADGRWCRVEFGYWESECNVSVRRHNVDWGDDCWFAGLPK